MWKAVILVSYLLTGGTTHRTMVVSEEYYREYDDCVSSLEAGVHALIADVRAGKIVLAGAVKDTGVAFEVTCRFQEVMLALR